jgi:hypothetical protein
MGYVLVEFFPHLILRLIFRQLHPDFINVRTAYTSKIFLQNQAQKNFESA